MTRKTPEPSLEELTATLSSLEPSGVIPSGDLASLSKEGTVGVAVGRGNQGKSFGLRWMVERAWANGRTLRLADADPMNRTLASVFDSSTTKVLQPKDGTDTAKATLARRLIDLARTDGSYIVLDAGGNDREIEAIGRADRSAKLDRLASWKNLGVLSFGSLKKFVVPFCFMSGSIDDLTGLKFLIDQPGDWKGLVLVNNYGCAPDLGHIDPFDTIRKNSIYQEALKKGAIEFRFPKLASDIARLIDENRLKFVDAIVKGGQDGNKILDLWQSEEIAIWLSDVEEQVERSGISRILP